MLPSTETCWSLTRLDWTWLGLSRLGWARLSLPSPPPERFRREKRANLASSGNIRRFTRHKRSAWTRRRRTSTQPLRKSAGQRLAMKKDFEESIRRSLQPLQNRRILPLLAIFGRFSFPNAKEGHQQRNAGALPRGRPFASHQILQSQSGCLIPPRITPCIQNASKALRIEL